MSTPVSVTVSHRLGKAEAMRRLKDGLAHTKGFGTLISVEQEVWSGDTLQFQMRALGQAAAGSIEVREDSLRIDVTLPWLLAKAAERILPTIRQHTTLLLEKK